MMPGAFTKVEKENDQSFFAMDNRSFYKPNLD